MQGRIIHEAGEAAASGPGPRQGPGNRPVQRKFSTTLGPEISTEKRCGFLKFKIQVYIF